MNCRIVMRDGTYYDVPACVERKSDSTIVYMKKESVPAECDYIDF